MDALQSAQEMMNRFENLSKRGGAWDGVEDDARDARDAAVAYAAIAQAEAMTRIAVALEAMRDMRQADAIWGAPAAAEVAADTDSLRGMWTPVEPGEETDNA